MDDVQMAMHNIKYRLDNIVMGYKQRYYSNHNNPRVIHTKLKDEILISLRTFPQDKYLIKAGEFLSLQAKYEALDKGKIGPLDTAITRGGELKDKEEDTVTVTSESITLLSGLDNYFFPLPKSKFLAANEDVDTDFGPLVPNNSVREQDQICSNILSPLMKPSIPPNLHKENLGEKSHSSSKHRMRSRFKSLMQTNPNQCPEILAFMAPEPCNLELSKQPPPLPPRRTTLEPSKVQTLVSKMSTPSFKSGCNGGTHVNNQDSDDRVWKSVLNDISLSAARVSTGSSLNKAQEFHNLSGDFIDAKLIQRSDAFAANLDQARLKYNRSQVTYDDGILSLYCDSD